MWRYNQNIMKKTLSVFVVINILFVTSISAQNICLRTNNDFVSANGGVGIGGPSM